MCHLFSVNPEYNSPNDSSKDRQDGMGKLFGIDLIVPEGLTLRGISKGVYP